MRLRDVECELLLRADERRSDWARERVESAAVTKGADFSGPQFADKCSYVEAAKKRGPPKGYVESMEIRVEKIERLYRRSFLRPISHGHSQNPLSPLAGSTAAEDDGAILLKTALNIKLDAEPQNAQRTLSFGLLGQLGQAQSPEPVPPPQYDFPPPDLAASLVDLYFAHINLLLPLLHRPIFARALAAGLHLTNDGFAATYLLVCAIGARFSSDPRVLLDGNDNVHSFPTQDETGVSPSDGYSIAGIGQEQVQLQGAEQQFAPDT
ncbi:hypothetical protein B0H14DRAFT_3674848 [Mycena olivaceomarginata]|nr:hypothetical protein B0H14DRAFT_3674848 [Mycena olivaceomarginata]